MDDDENALLRARRGLAQCLGYIARRYVCIRCGCTPVVVCYTIGDALACHECLPKIVAGLIDARA